MFAWLNRLLNRAPAVRLTPEEEAFLDEIVDAADPKIRLADDYSERLAPLFLAARKQVRHLILQVPQAMALTAENWRQQPALGCAFASPERMAEAVNADERLRQWFADHPLEERAFAILSMDHDRVTRYGMEEEGGIVRHDVPQETLVLRRHRFSRPADSLEGLSRLACQRAMEELAIHASRRIKGLQDDKLEIEDEISTLRLTLRLNGPESEYEIKPEQRARKEKLERLLEELARVRADLDPENLFKILEAALHNPEQQLRFSLLALHVDNMGVIRKAGSDARPVTLIEIEMMEEDPVRRVLMPVEIPRSLIRPQPKRDANDFLNASLF